MYGAAHLIARNLWLSKHPDHGEDPTLLETRESDERVNRSIEALLGTRISYSLDKATDIIPTLFERPLNCAELSPGQRALLAWALLLEHQGGHYPARIVLVDEPETHLHPDACWGAIESLSKIVGKDGQLWIATHSLPLVARATPDSVYFVSDNTARFAGSAPSRVWSSLLGGDGAEERLLAFIGGDAIAALVRYCAESLTPPESLPLRTSDPQATDFIAVVADRLAQPTPVDRVHILEYGAGHGRLAAALAGQLSTNQSARLRYTAFNDARFATSDEREHCQRQVAALQARGAVATYTETLEFQPSATDAPHLVVLANVLHEVPAEEWLGLFATLAASAAQDARLLVVEDQEPRIGELPHLRGFLLLEESEWRALAGDSLIAARRAHSGRALTMFTIPLQALTHVDKAAFCHAICLVKQRALNEIRRLRNHVPTNYAAGRKHAFYALLHINAVMALEALTEASTPIPFAPT